MSENKNTQLWNPEQRALSHYNSPKWKQMDFPLAMLRSKSASVSNAPLSLSRRFSPVFQFIGETTHASQGPLWWFPGASGSIQSHWWQMTNRATPMAVLSSISLFGLRREWGWGEGSRSREKVRRGAGGREGRRVGRGREAPKEGCFKTRDCLSLNWG